MTVKPYIMTDNRDWEWVDRYAEKMGDKALVEYSRKLFNYLHSLPDETEIVISDVVKAENAELFTKCICRFQFEGTLNLQFSADFKRLRKYEL